MDKGWGLLFLLTPPQQSKLARAAHHAEDDQHGANPVCGVVITVLKPSDRGNQGLCSWGHSVPQPHTADVHLPATAASAGLLQGLLWKAQGWSCLNVIPKNNAEFNTPQIYLCPTSSSEGTSGSRSISSPAVQTLLPSHETRAQHLGHPQWLRSRGDHSTTVGKLCQRCQLLVTPILVPGNKNQQWVLGLQTTSSLWKGHRVHRENNVI